MSWTWIRDSSPRARKAQSCCICSELIPVGERHIARSGFGDDGPETVRMHNECAEYADSDGGEAPFPERKS